MCVTCMSCRQILASHQQAIRLPCFICGSTSRIIEEKTTDGLGVKEETKLLIASFLSARNSTNCQFQYKIGLNNYTKVFNQQEQLNSNDSPDIYLHPQFVKGQLKENLNESDTKLIDYPQMQQKEREMLQSFLYLIFTKSLLEGTNKPSWKKKNGKIEPLLLGYWHYHLGPYNTQGNENNKSKIENLNTENLNGKKSGPVLHYLKINSGNYIKYIIIAFAIKHSQDKLILGDKGFSDKSKIIR